MMKRLSKTALIFGCALAVVAILPNSSYAQQAASASPFVGTGQGPGPLPCSTWTAQVGGNTDNGSALELWAIGDLQGIYEGYQVFDTVIFATTGDNFIGWVTGYCATNPNSHLSDVVIRFFNSYARVLPKK